MQTIEEIWERIEAWLKRYAPHIVDSFQPGASEAALAQAEAVLGVALTADLKALYLLHNGSNGRFFLDGWYLLSAEQMINIWQMGQDFFDEDLDLPPAGPVLRGSWHPRWIPFMSDGAGSYLCLDLAPGPGGGVGQVICQHKEFNATGPYAPSLYWYLAMFATELEAGDYYLDQFDLPDSEDRLSLVPMTWVPLPEAAPINQSDLVARVASRTGASIEETALIVETLFATIREALAGGSQVRLVGFGSFAYWRMPQRTAIDPQTGATVVAPEQTHIHFDCGSDLQHALTRPAEG